MKKFTIYLSLAAITLSLSACSFNKTNASSKQEELIVNKELEKNKTYAKTDFSFDVDPATFTVSITENGEKAEVSKPQEIKEVTDLKKSTDEISWTYPNEQLKVNLKKENNHLAVSITSLSDEDTTFNWPKLDAKNYVLPIAEGKTIPNDQKEWLAYFKQNEELSMSEAFSMSFFTTNQDTFATTFVMDNTFNSELLTKTEPHLTLEASHNFIGFDKNKTLNYRLYVTDNDPVAIAKTYQMDRINLGEFKTLDEKEKENPEIKKMRGAIQVYYWNSRILTTEDINWAKLPQIIDEPIFQWISELLTQYGEDGSEEYLKALDAFKNNEGYKYEKNTFLTSINYVLLYPQFYNKDIFKNPDEEAQKLIDKGLDTLSEQERYTLNKHLLASVIDDLTPPIEQWGQATSSDVFKDMKASGIDNAWIGLPNWANGLMNPAMVKTAVDEGYLIGPYDSYQSIQENASIDWNTASFPNKNLYEEATVSKKNGEKVAGFLGKGRKLNPTLIFPDVKERFNGIVQNKIPFNSWFLDTDAAGEIYNDYTPDHLTTQSEDVAGRLKRIDYFNQNGLVVGSEGGNDFASKDMVFAHGIETPVIMWSDPDMRENKESDYYVGSYAALDGGIPTKYKKVVPIKEEYKAIYTDPVYSLPLYKLVYNRSVITSHQWEWDSYKIKDQVGERRIKEYLYNTPPMMHIDKSAWDEHKQDISDNAQIWSPFQKTALKHEMTDFKILTENRLVQKTEFGDTLSVIANFSDTDYDAEGVKVASHTALIIDDGKETVVKTNG
ncbi:glycoside hydrolase [Enterococcus sp. AZ126]|uniref:glycoside hydrolase n=1 Tax=Enterococcus sp. AZ126 TaxID=2774635 RepID=UPI003F243EFC